jgi:Acyl-CoA carboxylase epsilon subunit
MEPAALVPANETGDQLIRVVRGVPTPEELAALVGALLVAGRRPSAAPVRASAWQRSARPGAAILPARAAPGGWRRAALPH